MRDPVAACAIEDCSQRPPFIVAASSGFIDAFWTFVKVGCPVDQRDPSNRNAYDLAWNCNNKFSKEIIKRCSLTYTPASAIVLKYNPKTVDG